MGAVILSVFISAERESQAQYSSPIRYNEGPGIRLSESLVLHPGLSLEGRYDSNVLFTDTNREAAPYLRVIGHFDIATRSPQRLMDGEGNVAAQALSFRLKAAAAYREYLSGDDAVVGQRALEANAGAQLRYAPTRSFALELADRFSRTVTARNAVITGGGRPSGTVDRDTNRAMAKLLIIPGGGRLQISTGYAFTVDAFENNELREANRFIHEIALNAKYNILPKTAVVLNATQGFYNYYNAARRTAANRGSKPLRATLGLAGLITPKLSTVLNVGYGNAFYEGDVTSFSSVIAKAELAYQATPLARIKLGYERLFADSTFGNYYQDHRVYAGYDHLVAQRFVLALGADYSLRQYRGFEEIPSVSKLDMHLLTGSASLDYQIKEWVYLGVGYDAQIQELISSLPIEITSTNFGLVDAIRHQVYAKVGISY